MASDTIELPKDRWPDWVMLETQGDGRFCGVMLHVWNPRGGWWGEGDEKFFVDGESFPPRSAPARKTILVTPGATRICSRSRFHAQTMTQNNQGHQSVLRWHILDNVPFQKSFEGCIEKYYPNERGTLYACTARWYLAPGGEDPYGPVPVELRDGYYVKPQLTLKGLKVLNEPAGEAQLQGMGPFGGEKWTDDQQLWWTGASRRPTRPRFARRPRWQARSDCPSDPRPDYAMVQLSLDDQKIGEPIDLYGPQVVPTGPINLGMHELNKGQHTLTVKIVGANPKAQKSYMVGIDRIELKPAK